MTTSDLIARTGPSIKRGKSKQDYKTPADFMAAVFKRFGPISFDLAASPENAQHANYFTEDENSLIQDWHKLPGLIWINPPFDNIAPWAKKCRLESSMGATILFLTVASVGANWFKESVWKYAEVLALNGRLSFDGIAPYPKDCMLSVFRSSAPHCYFDVWSWKDKQ